MGNGKRLAGRFEMTADMQSMTLLNAEWALRGKVAGSRDDYSIMACGEGLFRRMDFDAILSFFSSGTPAIWRQPEAMPTWATLNWQGIQGKRCIGLGVSRTNGSVDYLGRPIIYTSYFCVPYKSMADSGLSFLDLYLAVEPLQLPVADGRPIELAVRSSASDENTRPIASFDFEVIARTASLLLEGPVGIVDADQIGLLDRIRFIESVMSLLPYGFRASIAAATWAETASSHRIRLAFADQAPGGLQEDEHRGVVRLATGWTSTPTAPLASQYLQWLVEKI